MLIRILSFTVVLFTPVAWADMTPEQLEQWFNEDTPDFNKVNEGKLVFLTRPVKSALRSRNHFIIDEYSIEQGWVKLTQCYENIDAVPAAQVLYRFRLMRHLKIKSSKNIQHAYVDGNTVQLEHVQKNAQLCVTAQVRNFYQNPDGSFSMVNGPFHRRFLDGYYPFQLSMDIQFDKQLNFVSSTPKHQPGFTVKHQAKRIMIDTVFEGRLKTEFNFELRKH